MTLQTPRCVRSQFSYLAAAVVSVLVACSSTEPSRSSDESGDDDDDSSESETSPGDDDSPDTKGKPSSGKSANGALKVVNLSSTVSTVTGGAPLKEESDSVTFVAIVTNTKGLDAVAGGQLVDDEGKTYAAFGAGANKGTYTATVTFDAINKVSPIDFVGKSGSRTFSAKFFDNDGNDASASLTLTLACRVKSGLVSSCTGQCIVDPQVDGEHCGACGNQCAANLVCAKGSCVKPTTNCFSDVTVSTKTTCATFCASVGKSCFGAFTWNSAPCRGTDDVTSEYEDCDTSLHGERVVFQCGCK